MTPVLPTGCVIALLGARGSGKTGLAQQLAQRLVQRGIAATLVPDPLEAWQRRESREPLRHEYAAMAHAQTRRIAAAAEGGVVVADTTALSLAVSSELLFDDTSLHDAALAAHEGYAVPLLMALDPRHAGPDTGEQTDARLRAALGRARTSYAVIHGSGAERLASAWNAINARADAQDAPSHAGQERAWSWTCDKCSDPACEHRLFSDLVARRS